MLTKDTLILVLALLCLSVAQNNKRFLADKPEIGNLGDIEPYDHDIGNYYDGKLDDKFDGEGTIDGEICFEGQDEIRAQDSDAKTKEKQNLEVVEPSLDGDNQSHDIGQYWNGDMGDKFDGEDHFDGEICFEGQGEK